MVRSGLCEFSDTYIVVEGDITLEGDKNVNKRNKNLAFKNNAPFINCISKIKSLKINNAEDLDVVIRCIFYLNTVKTTEKQQTVSRIITEMNQVILFLLILNNLNTRQVL